LLLFVDSLNLTLLELSINMLYFILGCNDGWGAEERAGY
jgi:hypothetical protein